MFKNEPDASKRVIGPIPFFDLDGNFLPGLTFLTASSEVFVSEDGVTWVAAANDAAAIGSGAYRYQATQAESNTDSFLAVKLHKAGYQDIIYREGIIDRVELAESLTSTGPIVWADVIDYAPELVRVSTGARAGILAYVNTALNVSIVGGTLGEDSPKLHLARIYLAAHMGTIGPSSGVVASEGEGDLSISYQIPPGGHPYWYRTGYGAAFDALMRTTRVVLPMVI